MPTCQQIIRGCRKKQLKKPDKYLKGQPQVSGVVLSVGVRKPKKPNSANRSVVKVKLSNGMTTYAFVPGEKHNLQPHSKVLIRGGRRKDLIGINLTVVRGAKRYDCAPVQNRKTSRSLYGVSKT